MSGFTLQTWIDASPEKVFALMTTPDRATEIMPNIISLEQISDGPLAAGSRLRETRLVRGEEATTELVVRELQPATRYAVSTEQSGVTITYRYQLYPAQGGTNLEMAASVTGHGLKKLMVPLVVGIMKREDGDHLEQIKAVAERRA